MVIVLGETMGFVPNVLKQSQSERVAANTEWFALSGQVDFFFTFCQRDHHRRFDLALIERGECRVQLAFSSVDHQYVWEYLVLVLKPPVPSSHDFVNAAEVVDALHVPDLVSTIAGLEWQAVDKLHQAGYSLAAAQMRNVHALDRAWCLGQFENLTQPSQAFFRVDIEDFRLRVRVQFPSLIERFQHPDFVSQLGGLLEVQGFGGVQHVVAHVL